MKTFTAVLLAALMLAECEFSHAQHGIVPLVRCYNYETRQVGIFQYQCPGHPWKYQGRAN